jgi:tetrahydromethanopterin S-methyltransferase subunit E
MTEYLAQLLLIVEASEARINSRLQSIGFFPREEVCPHLDVGPILFMGFVMTVGMLALVAVLLPPAVPTLPLPMIAILIGATRTIGVLTAILPKLHWNTQRADDRHGFPYSAWLEWAFVAGALSFLIERTAIAMAHHTLSAELDITDYPLSPMAPLAFATSLSIAILCDVDLRLGNGLVRRIVEGVLCAGALTFTMFICTQLLGLTPATKGQAPSWLPLVVSSSLGFVCGFVAPHLYRRARQNEPVLPMVTPQPA